MIIKKEYRGKPADDISVDVDIVFVAVGIACALFLAGFVIGRFTGSSSTSTTINL